MAAIRHVKHGMYIVGRPTTVLNDDRAKLMYYLDCVCSVLQITDPGISRLRQYQYYWLSFQQEVLLMKMCALLNPTVLTNKCIFPVNSIDDGSDNAFYDITQVERNLVVARSLLIGGQQRRVQKVMLYKPTWIMNYWNNPMQV